MDVIDVVAEYIVRVVETLGYIGIVVSMAIESSLIPLPSELVMIPAGVLVSKGSMDFVCVVIAGTVGSYIGSLANYLFSSFLGRPLVLRYGKYCFLPEAKLVKMEMFFIKYGSISIFIARLLPVVRHFISIPAGIAKMNIYLFSFYTITGSAIWMVILTIIGYFVGENTQRLRTVVPLTQTLVILCCIIGISAVVYKSIQRKKNR